MPIVVVRSGGAETKPLNTSFQVPDEFAHLGACHAQQGTTFFAILGHLVCFRVSHDRTGQSPANKEQIPVYIVPYYCNTNLPRPISFCQVQVHSQRYKTRSMSNKNVQDYYLVVAGPAFSYFDSSSDRAVVVVVITYSPSSSYLSSSSFKFEKVASSSGM